MIQYTDILNIMLIAFIIALIVGPIMIPLLKRLKIGQSIREEGPKSHHKKTGTPTMGGIIFLIALIITVFTSGMIDSNTYVLILATLGFGLIGFIDDYIKVVKKRNLGLNANQKLAGQILFATMLAIYQYSNSELGTNLIVPFFKKSIYKSRNILYSIYYICSSRYSK